MGRADLAIPKGVDSSNPGRKGNSRPPGDWDLNGRLGSTAKLGNVSASGSRKVVMEDLSRGTKAADAAPRWFSGVTHKCRFGFDTIFLLFKPKNAFFHRDCTTLRSHAATRKSTSGLRKAGGKLD